MLKKLLIALVALGVHTPLVAADAETDVQTMLNKLLPIAEDLLLDHGEFFPFGGAMKEGGEVVTISGIDGLNNDQPPASEVIEMLDINLRIGAENDQYYATAVVSNVNVVPPGQSEQTRAIAIMMDHRDGLSMTLVFPYVVKETEVELGQLFAKANERKIFDRLPAPAKPSGE